MVEHFRVHDRDLPLRSRAPVIESVEMIKFGVPWTIAVIVVAAGVTGCFQDESGEQLSPGEPAAFVADDTVEFRILVPEAYELANVALALTKHGRERPGSVIRRGAYYERMLQHFEPHSRHALIELLEEPVAASFSNYYGFRENAFSYAFDGAELLHTGDHHDIWSPDLFTNDLDTVEAFAAATDFRKFYEAESTTYAQQVDRYGKLVDLARMAGWLHTRFPDRRMDAYTVVFSPLIGGSHSTRNFAADGRREAVMFIAGPDLPLGEMSDAARSGVHERVVFTEIDHNYVNEVTDAFIDDVRSTFRDWRAWNTKQGYRSPYATFNEYMTWGVFTLYAADTYDAPTFRAVVARSERVMYGRGFVHFRAFNRELLRLYRERRPETVAELYAPILVWARKFPGPRGSSED